MGLPHESPSNWYLIRRMLGLAWVYRWGCILIVTQQLILVAFMLLGLSFAGFGIDYIRHHAQGLEGPVTWRYITVPQDWPHMLVIAGIALAVLLFALLRAAFKYQAVMTTARLTQKIIVALRSNIYAKLQQLSFRFFDANESGSIINRVTGDVQAVRMFVDRVLIQAITILATLTVYLIYMLKIHVWLTLACLATLPLLWGGAILYSRIVRPLFLESRKRIDHTVRTLAENIQGMHVVKCFARENEEIHKFESSNQQLHDHNYRIFFLTSVFSPTIGMLTQVNIVILLGYGGYLVMTDQLALGLGLVVFAELLRQLANQITMLANLTSSVQMCLTGAQRVFEVLDASIEIQSKPDAIQVKRVSGAVRFEHVRFGYRPDDPVLEDIDFEAKPGQCIAILGATGAGKSTLLSMIPRFYDPQSGRVLVDGIDLRDLNLDDLRRNIGIVFQESFLFSTTVAQNIAFGHPSASREQIEQAARIAAAHDFIMKLKNGYDTVIGENGVDLSGGQRQRIAIARAVLLEPPILLLDDATSAIDPETEHEIHLAMNNAMRGRTTFVVAHRLSTLRRADLVIVLNQGRIAQVGTHDELMNTKGHYRRAAKLQVADAESLRLLDQAFSPEVSS